MVTVVKIIATCKNERTSCDNCGSRLEYLPIDVKQGSRRDCWGDTHIYKYIICPVCGEETKVYGNES
nr:MAG TPA: DNA-directed RNA polymerase [Caudoviricetes sp.]